MPYSLVTSTVLANGAEAQYQTVDLSTLPMNLIFSQYAEVYLTLYNPYLPSNVYVDLMSYKETLAGYAGTISQWLGNIGNLTLNTVAALPSTTVEYARFSDATYSGYKMSVTKVGFQIPLNYPTDMLPDLQISRPNYKTDVTLINKNCLVSVNGYLHQTDNDGKYSYILQGANTMRKSNLNHVGLISFLDIGTVTTVPIDTTKVYADSTISGATLKDKMYLYLNQDLTNQTVLLSLGGYLVFPDQNLFYMVGNNTFCLQTASLPLAQRYFESSQYIDLSSLGLDTTTIYPNTINLQQLLSDATLLKYLSLSQSFWIIIDTPSLKFDKLYMEDMKLPGMFVAYAEPVDTLFVGYGRIAEYWKVEEDTQWSVNVENSYLNNYVFATDAFDGLQNINSANVPYTPAQLSKGYMLRIHT